MYWEKWRKCVANLLSYSMTNDSHLFVNLSYRKLLLPIGILLYSIWLTYKLMLQCINDGLRLSVFIYYFSIIIHYSFLFDSSIPVLSNGIPCDSIRNVACLILKYPSNIVEMTGVIVTFIVSMRVDTYIVYWPVIQSQTYHFSVTITFGSNIVSISNDNCPASYVAIMTAILPIDWLSW